MKKFFILALVVALRVSLASDIILNWDPGIDPVNGYRIYKAEDSDLRRFNPIATVPNNVFSLVQTNLPIGTNAWYVKGIISNEIFSRASQTLIYNNTNVAPPIMLPVFEIKRPTNNSPFPPIVTLWETTGITNRPKLIYSFESKNPASIYRLSISK